MPEGRKALLGGGNIGSEANSMHGNITQGVPLPDIKEVEFGGWSFSREDYSKPYFHVILHMIDIGRWCLVFEKTFASHLGEADGIRKDKAGEGGGF